MHRVHIINLLYSLSSSDILSNFCQGSVVGFVIQATGKAGFKDGPRMVSSISENKGILGGRMDQVLPKANESPAC